MPVSSTIAALFCFRILHHLKYFKCSLHKCDVLTNFREFAEKIIEYINIHFHDLCQHLSLVHGLPASLHDQNILHFPLVVSQVSTIFYQSYRENLLVLEVLHQPPDGSGSRGFFLIDLIEVDCDLTQTDHELTKVDDDLKQDACELSKVDCELIKTD